MGAAETATERLSDANPAIKSNNRPSHIDDWMYAKLAVVKSNVNENRLRILIFGGFPAKKPIFAAGNGAAEARIGRLRLSSWR